MIAFLTLAPFCASGDVIVFDLGTYVEVGVASPRSFTLRRDGTATSSAPSLKKATWFMDPTGVWVLKEIPKIDFSTSIPAFCFKLSPDGLSAGKPLFHIQRKTETVSIPMGWYARKSASGTSFLNLTSDGQAVLVEGSRTLKGNWSLSNGLGVCWASHEWVGFDFPSDGKIKPRDGTGVFTLLPD